MYTVFDICAFVHTLELLDFFTCESKAGNHDLQLNSVPYYRASLSAIAADSSLGN